MESASNPLPFNRRSPCLDTMKPKPNLRMVYPLLLAILISGCESASKDTGDDILIENIIIETSYEDNPALFSLQMMAKSKVYLEVCQFGGYEKYFLEESEYQLKRALFKNFDLKNQKETAYKFNLVLNKLESYYSENTGSKECNDWRERVNANRSMRDINPEISSYKTK